MLALASVASFMVALDALVVTTALSTIRVGPRRLDRGAGVDRQRLQPELRGAAADRRRARRPLRTPAHVRRRLGLFVAASAACALAGSVGWLIAARAVQGAGAALVMPLAMALLSAAFPREERGRRHWGSSAASPGSPSSPGPVVGGAIAQGLAWQWIFWINVPIGLHRHPARAAPHPRKLRTGRRSRHSAAWRW